MSDIETLVEVYTKAAHTAGANGDGTATLFIHPENGVRAVVAHLQEWIDHHNERADKAEVERWRNNFDNAQLQITDLVAEVERLKEVLGDGVRMAAAMNMTAGWVDSAKQILGGKS